MLARYVTRGLKAGLVAGGAYGLFVAWVGNPLIRYAETFERAHTHTLAHAHGGGDALVSGATTAAVSVAGGVLLGVLLGAVVFGALFYFLEPAIPGRGETKSYVLGAGGFLTVSGAPWLLLPPQPPGTEAALATEARLVWYAIMMVAGALACGLAGYVYARLSVRYGRFVGVLAALFVLGSLPVAAAIGPANPISGPVPVEFIAVYRAIVGAGQVGLWIVLAGAHEWFRRRERPAASIGENRATSAGTLGSVRSDP